MHVEYRPSLSISDLVKKLKGRSSRKIQQEFPELKKRYWVVIFGVLDLAVGVQVILQMIWLMNT